MQTPWHDSSDFTAPRNCINFVQSPKTMTTPRLALIVTTVDYRSSVQTQRAMEKVTCSCNMVEDYFTSEDSQPLLVLPKRQTGQTRRAAHGDELFYLFRSDFIQNNIEPCSPQKSVSLNMVQLWTNFAKTGLYLGFGQTDKRASERASDWMATLASERASAAQLSLRPVVQAPSSRAPSWPRLVGGAQMAAPSCPRPLFMDVKCGSSFTCVRKSSASPGHNMSLKSDIHRYVLKIPYFNKWLPQSWGTIKITHGKLGKLRGPHRRDGSIKHSWRTRESKRCSPTNSRVTAAARQLLHIQAFLEQLINGCWTIAMGPINRIGVAR
uniref:Carboxylesterase type B domain-containing protein n=1 Tax=Timema poppense TaxID=170557 RepID=A0A7R9D1J2_TIMPO|nr:unnamed protein product [Timema poppensis]